MRHGASPHSAMVVAGQLASRQSQKDAHNEPKAFKG